MSSSSPANQLLSISLVVPNLNSGSTLERCIQSILRQDYPDLQLIMADAGSTDVSRDIIAKYRDRFDVIISEKDDGQADGLNKGFTYATGELRSWLCADDELLPGALHHVNKCFCDNPEIDVVIGRCERVFPDGVPYVTPVDCNAWDNIIVRNTIEQPSTFWRSELHKKVGELDTSYELSFDWILWIWFRNAKATLLTTEEVLSRYYFTETSKCNNAGNLFAEETYRLLKQYGPLRGWLANIFRHIYYRYDLMGCMDKPPTSKHVRLLMYRATFKFSELLLGHRWMSQYNWHFASLQERGLVWWR